jgi:hypothetical protein
MRTFTRDCPCCGATFTAKHQAAKWCSSRCSMRAYQRRRRGAPEANPGAALVAAVVQPQILDDVEMPAAWAYPEPTVTNGLESRYWHGTAIERRQADGFVNATAMCKAGRKRLNDYLRAERTQEYIRALAASVVPEKHYAAAVAGNPVTASGLVDIRQGGQPHLQGTWVHPRLAVDLARWISPAFAVWMDGWFLESLTQPQPQRPALPKGVHVVADTHREACQLWWDAIRSEVSGALACRLNPAHRTDAGLPLSSAYSWQPSLI